MKKVIVTGAASQLGAALIDRLIRASEINKIYAVVRTSKNENAALRRMRIKQSYKVHILECDMDKYSLLPEMINDDCDTFYHMAWPRTATYDESMEDMLDKCDAVKGVLEALEAAKNIGCNKFIGAGSQSEYGIVGDGNYSIKTECRPVRADGIFHLAACEAGRILANISGISFIWMRIFSIYGINDRNNSMISSTIDKLMKGEHCAFTQSVQKWDYLYSDDAAEAFYLVGSKVCGSRIYNLASGEERELREYIEIIRDIVSPDAFLGIGELKYPSNPIMNMKVDISELKNDADWRPKVDFETGIRYIYENRCKKT